MFYSMRFLGFLEGFTPLLYEPFVTRVSQTQGFRGFLRACFTSFRPGPVGRYNKSPSFERDYLSFENAYQLKSPAGLMARDP